MTRKNKTVYKLELKDGKTFEKNTKKKLLKLAEAKQDIAEDSEGDLFAEVKAVYRLRKTWVEDEVEISSGLKRDRSHWSTQKKVALQPEKFPQTVKTLQKEKERLVSTAEDTEAGVGTDFRVETQKGEVALEEYRGGQ